MVIPCQGEISSVENDVLPMLKEKKVKVSVIYYTEGVGRVFRRLAQETGGRVEYAVGDYSGGKPSLGNMERLAKSLQIVMDTNNRLGTLVRVHIYSI